MPPPRAGQGPSPFGAIDGRGVCSLIVGPRAAPCTAYRSPHQHCLMLARLPSRSMSSPTEPAGEARVPPALAALGDSFPMWIMESGGSTLAGSQVSAAASFRSSDNSQPPSGLLACSTVPSHQGPAASLPRPTADAAVQCELLVPGARLEAPAPSCLGTGARPSELPSPVQRLARLTPRPRRSKILRGRVACIMRPRNDQARMRSLRAPARDGDGLRTGEPTNSPPARTSPAKETLAKTCFRSRVPRVRRRNGAAPPRARREADSCRQLHWMSTWRGCWNGSAAAALERPHGAPWPPKRPRTCGAGSSRQSMSSGRTLQRR